MNQQNAPQNQPAPTNGPPVTSALAAIGVFIAIGAFAVDYLIAFLGRTEYEGLSMPAMIVMTAAIAVAGILLCMSMAASLRDKGSKVNRNGRSPR